MLGNKLTGTLKKVQSFVTELNKGISNNEKQIEAKEEQILALEADQLALADEIAVAKKMLKLFND